MTDCVVRKANSHESDLIAGFQIAMAKETEDVALSEPIVSEGVKAVFKNPGKGQYYVAEINNEVIACMLITTEWSDWRNGTFLWFQSIYVKPEFRGKSVFKQMYNHIRSLVEADKNLKGIRLYVFHTNKKAQAVYKSVGMDDEFYRLFEWVKQ